MYQVIKRNDKVVDFDLAKIANAIRKAFEILLHVSPSPVPHSKFSARGAAAWKRRTA